MSEYQVYEFIALDRPLTEKQMAELRGISTRAEITPTRFWNEYHWGDLKANPAELVTRYFDAHLYFANWGTHRLIFRLPAARVDIKQMRSYLPGHAASLSKKGEHVVLDLRSETEEPEDDFTRGALLAALLPVRSELLRGDMRAAYIAWLLAVNANANDVDDATPEPPLPPGLLNLSAPLKVLVEFLRIDPISFRPPRSAAVRRWKTRALSTRGSPRFPRSPRING
jgi:hypothetical protein